MKSVVAVVLALCVAFVASQSASTNPAGTSYFFPSTLLPLNTTVSSTLYNTTGNYYADFYRVWVPAYVKTIEWMVNNTGSDSNWVEVSINVVASGGDSSFGYSCNSQSGYSYNSPCNTNDQYFEAYMGDDQSESYNAAGNMAPGNWQYASVSRYYTTSNYTTYTLIAKPTDWCTNTSIVIASYDAGITLGCAELSTVSNVSTNGQSFTAQTVSGTEVDIYRVVVPENVTRVYAWIASDQSYLYTYTSADWVATDSYYSTDYTYSGTYNSTTGKYNFWVEYPRPTANHPVYFGVTPYSSDATYDITISWIQCDSTHAGYGDIQVDTYAGVSYFDDEPDCQYTIANNNVNYLTALTTQTVTVAPYNSTSDYYQDGHATFITAVVPANTVGSLNFTCNSTTDSTFVTFSLNRMATCDNYIFGVACTGGGYTSTDYQALLSHDLFPGGWWSIAACNSASASSATVSLVASGTLSAAPSASPSSGSDESASSAVVPALLFTVLAAVLAF